MAWAILSLRLLNSMSNLAERKSSRWSVMRGSETEGENEYLVYCYSALVALGSQSLGRRIFKHEKENYLRRFNF